MTPATASALLLLAAGLLHSFSYMCRKLPRSRRPSLYPRHPSAQIALDVLWIALLLVGLSLAFALSPILGATAVVIYFVALPFVFQPPIARMMGFKGLRDYLEATGRK